MTESWAGPGNEARTYLEYSIKSLTLLAWVQKMKRKQLFYMSIIVSFPDYIFQEDLHLGMRLGM